MSEENDFETVIKDEDYNDDEVTSAFCPIVNPKEEAMDENDVESSPNNYGPNHQADEQPAPTRNKTDYGRKKEWRLEARKWIGVVISKTIGDESYKGKVVEYQVKNGWFKVMYDDNEKEEVSKNELLQLMTNPEAFIDSASLLPPSSETHRPKRKKVKSEKKSSKKIRERGRVNMATASNVPITAGPPVPVQLPPQRTPRKAKQPTTFVPLALTESKKDDYYWYWP